MYWQILLLFMLGGVPLSLQAQDLILAPAGKAVMIDGNYSFGEWEDASMIDLKGGVKAYFKRVDSFLVACFKTDTLFKGWVNVFIDGLRDTTTVNLHSSGRLGERYLQFGSWVDWESWWNNDRWTANYNKHDCTPCNCNPGILDDAKEFQIDLRRFDKPELRMMVEISLDTEDGFKRHIYPRAGINYEPNTFAEIRFK